MIVWMVNFLPSNGYFFPFAPAFPLPLDLRSLKLRFVLLVFSSTIEAWFVRWRGQFYLVNQNVYTVRRNLKYFCFNISTKRSDGPWCICGWKESRKYKQYEEMFVAFCLSKAKLIVFNDFICKSLTESFELTVEHGQESSSKLWMNITSLFL